MKSWRSATRNSRRSASARWDKWRERGGLVLFVSHNMHAVGALCRSALCLIGGRICAMGSVREVIDQYLNDAAADSTAAEATWSLEDAPGDSFTRLVAVRVVNERGETAYNHDISKPVTIDVEFALLRPHAAIDCSIHVYNQESICLFAVGSAVRVGDGVQLQPGIYRSSCVIPANYLNDGVHRVSAFVVQNKTHWPAHVEQAVSFCANDDGSNRDGYLGKIIGAVRPILPWNSQRVGGLP